VNEIEERLRDAFDADAQTVRPDSLRPPPGRDAGLPRPTGGLRRGNWLTPLAAAAAVAAVVVAVAVVVPRIWTGGPAHKPRHQQRHATATRQPRTFLTVTTSPPVIHGDHLLKYQAFTLEKRSAHHGGRLIRVLMRSLGAIDAVVAPDGSVVAVADYGCRSQVFRIDPGTGARRLIRTLPESAQNMALSPDGSKLAYLTYPASDRQPCGPARQPTAPVRYQVNPGGLAQFLPSVVAIVDLATGTGVRAASANPGDPPWSLSWSPDGKTVAAVYSNSVELLSAAHPDFAAARRLRPPSGCGYVASTWTVSGILAVLGCGKQDPALSPRTLIRLSTAGQRTQAWRLPACIDGVHLVVDPTRRYVLVQSDVGYGNGRPCGLRYMTWSARILRVRRDALTAIAVLPLQGGDEPQVTGW